MARAHPARRHSGIVGAAALVAGVLGLSACGPAATGDQSATPGAPRPTTSESPGGPTLVPTPPQSGWRRIEIPMEEVLTTVVPVAGGLLAFGGRTCDTPSPDAPPTACFAAAALSDTGESWLLLDRSAATDVGTGLPLSGPTGGFVAAAHGSSGTVIVGYETAAENEVTPLVWLLGDDGTIDRLPDTTVEPGARWGGVAWSPLGYVVVGTEVGGAAPRFAAWRSADGRSWERVPDSPVFDVGPYVDTMEAPGFGGPLGVTSSPNGFVAVGHTIAADGRTPTWATWTSTDGWIWDLSVTPPIVGSLRDVAWGSAGGIAVGVGCGQDCFAHAARTIDQSAWTETAIGGVPELWQVEAVAEGYVALGWEPWGQPGAWLTLDGSSWDSLELPAFPGHASVIGLDIAELGGRPIIVGAVQSDDEVGLHRVALLGPTLD